MKTFGRILKFIFIFLYFIALVYLLIFNSYFSEFYGVSLWTIPLLAVLSILLASYNFIKIYIKVNVIEAEFTSIVNHTFRTPLTKIMWALTELKSPQTEQNKVLGLQTIENSASRVLSIVDMIAGMQDVGNKSTYFFTAISIREIIEKSISKYRGTIGEKKLNLQIGTFNDIPLLTADLKKLSFVFDCAMENAIYYTQNGGNIMVGAIQEHNKIVFYVADNGIGLTMFEKFRLFSKFFRGERARKLYTDGMGLSLYLARKIMISHNGKVYAKSSGINKGTTLLIELPLK